MKTLSSTPARPSCYLDAPMSILHSPIASAALLALVATTRLASQAPRRLVLTGATLIDGTGAPPVPNSVVLIENGRIVRAGAKSDVAIPRGAEQIDLAGLTVLPGLIDSHVHISFKWTRKLLDGRG
jgi:imidazolonepropionase-like amidohydrolase